MQWKTTFGALPTAVTDYLCCCSLPAQERTIQLEAIGQKTKLDVDGVEFLLMKTLSLHLIEGIVDQVDGNVKVTPMNPFCIRTKLSMCGSVLLAAACSLP